MSHYSLIGTIIKNLNSLVAALKMCGFSQKAIEISSELLELRGYKGDVRKQRANVRIKGSGWAGENYVGGASNDLGFELMPDGTYAFHVSDYDRGKYGPNWQKELFANYSQDVTIKELELDGFQLEEVQETSKSKRRLVLRRSC